MPIVSITARSGEDIVKDRIISQDVGASDGDHKDKADFSNDSEALAVDDGRIKNVCHYDRRERKQCEDFDCKHPLLDKLQERFVEKSSSNLDVNNPGQYCDDSVVREGQMADFNSKNEDDLKGKNEDLNTFEYSADNNEFEECRKAIGKRVSDVQSKTEKVNNEKTPQEKEQKVLKRSSIGSSKHAMTKLKKGTILLVVVSVVLTQVESKTIPSRSTDSTDLNVLSYDLLITDICSLSNLNRSQACQLNENQLAYTIQLCGFQKLCKEGYKARCVNTLQGGMAHICTPANLSCQEGFRRIAWIDKDNPSVVKVQVEKCPKGTFQPSKSNGFDACTTKHLDITDIPKKYLLYREGNNSAATYVYCNYKEGYFNLENKTFLNYDEESAYDHHFCMHINDIPPNWFNCSDQKSLLPNGTCVSNCLPGECRDAHNDFVCKMNCSLSALVSDDDDHDDNDDKAVQRSGETTTMESVIKVYKTQEPGDTHDKQAFTKTIIIIAICISIFVPLVVVIVPYLSLFSRYHRSSTASIDTPPASSDGSGKYTPSSASVSTAFEESETNPLHGSQPPTWNANNTEVKTVFESQVETVNIYTYGSETGRVCQYLSKQDCVVDDERSDFGKDDRLSTNSVVVRDTSKEIEVPKTRSHKDSDPACQDDARTPLLGEDCEEEASSNQRQEPFGTCAVMTDAIDLQNSDGREKSCPRPTTKFENFKKDIDDANTQAVVNSLNNSMFSCGALIYEKKVAGTVFLVGQYFIMTAFHVIRDIIKDPTGGTRFLFSKLENSDDVTVNFNESICDHSRRRFRLKYRFHDEALDVAVLEIIDIAELEDFPEGLLLWKYDISHLDVKKIHMIGYGHVDNPFEKHLETCEIVQDFQNRFREALASLKTHRQEYIDDLTNQGKDPSFVDLGYAHLDDPELIPFDCCMEKGLSGAPILKTEGNSSKVIGIVLGGKPDFFYQLSREKKLSFERRYLIEVGMKMQMIYESIASKDPTLAGQLFNGE